jgi:hypothetical protein
MSVEKIASYLDVDPEDLEIMAQEVLEKVSSSGLGRYAELLAGGKKMTFLARSKTPEMLTDTRPGNVLRALLPGNRVTLKAKREALKSLAARLGTGGAVAAGAYGLKKLRDRYKKSKSKR